MGRGRQKAKATKQARDMKYFSPETDYSALQRELHGAPSRSSQSYSAPSYSDDFGDYEDKYAVGFDDDDDDEVKTRRIG